MTPVEIRTVGIVGLGQMGAGIAQVCILAGIETVGREVTSELAERGRETAERYVNRGVDKGRLTGEERDAALARLTVTDDLSVLAKARSLRSGARPDLGKPGKPGKPGKDKKAGGPGPI